ncbi:DNA replication protein [Pediococcus pentosaceus]|uniref:DNA replication protein n=1 Tax=Pediococcus pentosaceus TaxID=1255 RepID=UPI001F573D8C|nr:DNA replication protein [Pediococcus pentosaceus]MCI2960651.1 DNA replication protein [Pediococcus pentosaceus]
MAQRRMFSKKITDTDIFLDMPLSSQALYFHLNMHADDDGFVSNAKTVKRMIGSSDDDLKLLLTKNFIFAFESGVVVIKDWKIHNYIRKDTYNTTIYSDEKDQLTQDENGSYTLSPRAVDEPSPQVRLGKDRLGKDNNIYSSSDDEPSSFETDFEVIWKEYPNKTGKKQAFNHYKSWRKKSKENTNDYLMNKLAMYKKHLALNSWKKPMNGSTWFNGRFDDELDMSVQSKAKQVVQRETLPDWAIDANSYSDQVSKKSTASTEEINGMLKKLHKRTNDD